MRTTIDLPDPLYRRLKATAALRGASLKQYVTQTLQARLETEVRPKRPGKRVKFPLVRSKHPGTLHLTNRMIEEILTAEDARAITGH